jgi:hypothetical protein
LSHAADHAADHGADFADHAADAADPAADHAADLAADSAAVLAAVLADSADDAAADHADLADLADSADDAAADHSSSLGISPSMRLDRSNTTRFIAAFPSSKAFPRHSSSAKSFIRKWILLRSAPGRMAERNLSGHSIAFSFGSPSKILSSRCANSMGIPNSTGYREWS